MTVMLTEWTQMLDKFGKYIIDLSLKNINVGQSITYIDTELDDWRIPHAIITHKWSEHSY